jgi:hypothetical protein
MPHLVAPIVLPNKKIPNLDDISACRGYSADNVSVHKADQQADGAWYGSAGFHGFFILVFLKSSWMVSPRFKIVFSEKPCPIYTAVAVFLASFSI